MKRTSPKVKSGGVSYSPATQSLLTRCSKALRFFVLALFSVMSLSTALAEEITLTFPDDNKASNKISAYNESWTAKIGTDEWTITNFNNNQWKTWTYIKCGRKNNASTASIATSSAIESAVTSVVVTVDKFTSGKVNSIKLLVASDADYSSVVETVTASTISTGAMTFTVTSPTENCYYKLVFDCASGSSNGLIQISKVVYNLQDGSASTKCSAPSFSPASGTTFDESLTVTATTSTESANIVYNTDNGETFSDFPADGLTLTETTTIYAKAVDPTSALSESSVVSATYTKVEALDGIKALRDQIKADGVTSSSSAKTYTVKLTNAVVTKVGDKMASIEQDGYGIYYYNRTTNPFTAGQTITGTITVTGYVYNGWAEIATVDLSNATTTTGEAPDPTTATIAAILADYDSYESRYVRIEGAAATSAFSSKKATFSQTEGETTSSIEAYDTNGSSLSVTKGNSYNIEGILGFSSTTKRFNILSAADIEDASTSSVTAPTFNPAGGTYTEAQTVTITADEGATIFYTTDGDDPSKSSTSVEYTTPITISETTTLKAVAMDNDGNMSDVTTATYVINIQTLTGDGSEENPYTINDVKLLYSQDNEISQAAWVKGYIVGSCANGSASKLATTNVDSNIALADDASSTTDFIPAGLNSKNNLQAIAGVKSNSSNIGKEVIVYGTITKYFGTAGVTPVSKIKGLATINIAAEGYGTFYAVSPYEMPEGLTGGTITAADTENGTLTINYKYAAGSTVPAGTSLLIKASETKDHESGDVGQKTYYAVTNIATSTQADTDDNLLHGADAVTSGTTAVDATNGGTVRYYILSHSADQTDFGFYWAAEDGAAITYQAPYAFLAVETTGTSVKGFSLSDSATGINAVSTDENAPATIYDLQGRRVNAATRGLYIVNGKKVLVK